MAPSSIRKALGAVKDQTSIGIAMVGNSTSLSDLEVAIVKATSHEEYVADERHIKEILSLTCYSRVFISACVNIISRRLNKTRNWVVALKGLMLIHRLLIDGDAAYEQEIFYATRRGTRLLNLSDFRDTSRSGSWDFSSFVRTYALYLDERLEYRMQGRRKRRSKSMSFEEEEEKEEINKTRMWLKASPVRDMKTPRIFTKTNQLLNLLERFLACRPTGEARDNRVILVALYAVVKESIQIYYDITEITGILVDRFMELEIPECVKMHDLFSRIGKQFDELDHFYSWCRTVGVARSSDFPNIERITQKKLNIMNEFIREKSAMVNGKKVRESNFMSEMLKQDQAEQNPEHEEEVEDLNDMKALPAPETFVEPEPEPEPEPDVKEEPKKEEIVVKEVSPKKTQTQGDLLNLYDASENTSVVQGDKLALALFDGEAPASEATSSKSPWEAFESSGDWETALVQSATNLSGQKPELAGGFDTMLLDSMYQQQEVATAMSSVNATGSASSVALGSAGRPAMLALPAPPVSNGGARAAPEISGDPFSASLSVAPPSYVQMSDMENKQKLLMEEQMMWQQYAMRGTQSHTGMTQYTQYQHNNPYSMGGY